MAIIDAGARTEAMPKFSPLRADRAVGNDDWGAFSIEKFAGGIGGLQYTHEDADGFLAYLTNFRPANFHYMDAGVKVWAYEEQFDAWQDQYGFDAACAVYHSGHGTMDANGVFSAPMGAPWENRGIWASSTNMALGNEAARYIFWSTCLSLRVLGGQSPVTTWWNPCLGFRMLFGFETTSVDDPNYGKNFWNHWNAGDSLSKAWLNGSWDISHGQAPSVMAVGATQAEAVDRVHNERFLTRERATRNWFAWIWYNAVRSAERNITPPADLLVADFAPPPSGDAHARSLMDRFELDVPELVRSPRGIMVAGAEDDAPLLAIHPDGAVDVRLATPQRESTATLGARAARSTAESAISRFGLVTDVDVAFDGIRELREAGGTDDGSGERVAPRTVETTVEFRQVVNGVPIVTPGAGALRVTIDNEGTVTHIHDSSRPVERLRGGVGDMPGPDGERIAALALPEPGSASADGGIDAVFGPALRDRLLGIAVRGGAALGYEVVPGSTVVGYDLRGDSARPVARREVEFELGSGLRKRYALVAPLAE